VHATMGTRPWHLHAFICIVNIWTSTTVPSRLADVYVIISALRMCTSGVSTHNRLGGPVGWRKFWMGGHT
jgi:hypothetical protein